MKSLLLAIVAVTVSITSLPQSAMQEDAVSHPVSMPAQCVSQQEDTRSKDANFCVQYLVTREGRALQAQPATMCNACIQLCTASALGLDACAQQCSRACGLEGQGVAGQAQMARADFME